LSVLAPERTSACKALIGVILILIVSRRIKVDDGLKEGPNWWRRQKRRGSSNFLIFRNYDFATIIIFQESSNVAGRERAWTGSKRVAEL
jgi:hypothetical protein